MKVEAALETVVAFGVFDEEEVEDEVDEEGKEGEAGGTCVMRSLVKRRMMSMVVVGGWGLLCPIDLASEPSLHLLTNVFAFESDGGGSLWWGMSGRWRSCMPILILILRSRMNHYRGD